MLLALVPVAIAYVAAALVGRRRSLPARLFGTLVLAGGAGGLFFGLFAATTVEAWWSLILEDETAQRALGFSQPIAEEVGKALVLLLVIRSRAFRSPVDGLLFGFTAGAGFAAVENCAYLVFTHETGGVGAWLTSALMRVPASVVVHGGSSAVVGAALSDARWDRRPLVVLGAPAAALFLASWIHGGWNLLVDQAFRNTSAPHAIGAVTLLLGVLLLLYVIALYGTEVERRVIREELGDTLDRDSGLHPVAIEAVTAPGDRRVFNWLRRRAATRAIRRALIDLVYALRRERLEAPEGAPSEVEERRRRLADAVAARRAELDGDRSWLSDPSE